MIKNILFFTQSTHFSCLALMRLDFSQQIFQENHEKTQSGR